MNRLEEPLMSADEIARNFEKSKPYLRKVLSKYGNSSEDVEDLISEMRVKVLRKPPSVYVPWQKWISRVARRGAIEVLRNRSRRVQALKFGDMAVEGSEVAADVIEVIPAPFDDPVERLNALAIYDRLSPREQLIVDALAQGYDREEIAKMAKRHSSTIRTIIREMRQRLSRDVELSEIMPQLATP